MKRHCSTALVLAVLLVSFSALGDDYPQWMWTFEQRDPNNHVIAGHWHKTLVDSDGDVGQYTSHAIWPQTGAPAITYYDRTNGYLKRALRDPDNGVWVSEAINYVGMWGAWNDLATRPDANQWAISYYTNSNGANGRLLCRWYDGSEEHWTVVDNNEGDVGKYNSVAISPDTGHPMISYYDASTGWLKFAWFDADIGEWWTTLVDRQGDTGQYSSLVILPSGDPAISYCAGGSLRYARWSPYFGWVVTVVDYTGIYVAHTSLAVLGTGQPAISYYWAGDALTNGLKFAWYDGEDWHTTVVDSGGQNEYVGRWTSLAVLPTSGQPAISYAKGAWNAPDQLRYARHTGGFDFHEGWHTERVDDAGAVGSYSSLAVLPSGDPAISYCDQTHGDLKYARWTPEYDNSD
jgi:hypothetical protein